MPKPKALGRTLGDAVIGETVSIAGYADRKPARRLISLGLVPGASITVVRRAPLGDPTEYAVRGSRIAIRRSEASTILVVDP
ncbi:MAG TPA: FeoA family protein [Acidimicrobiia bacterium]|nr:FeoA family protein [Acidimicrobiia bacterium]